MKRVFQFIGLKKDGTFCECVVAKDDLKCHYITGDAHYSDLMEWIESKKL
jgi:hypothetical protein